MPSPAPLALTRWKLPDASSKPIGACARYSEKRPTSTWTLVAAWNWFVVREAAIVLSHEQPPTGHDAAPGNKVRV